MALDALAEVVLRAVGGFIVEFVFVGIFYWPGWLFLRVLTFGRYPPQRSLPHSEEFVGIFGFSVIAVAFLFTMSGGGL